MAGDDALGNGCPVCGGDLVRRAGESELSELLARADPERFPEMCHAFACASCGFLLRVGGGPDEGVAALLGKWTVEAKLREL